jgi:hypothetical protein
MAGFNIKFLAQQFGEKEISSAIAKLRLRLDNIRPVLDQIGQIYLLVRFLLYYFVITKL